MGECKTQGNWMCRVWNRGANSITDYFPPAPSPRIPFRIFPCHWGCQLTWGGWAGESFYQNVFVLLLLSLFNPNCQSMGLTESGCQVKFVTLQTLLGMLERPSLIQPRPLCTKVCAWMIWFIQLCYSSWCMLWPCCKLAGSTLHLSVLLTYQFLKRDTIGECKMQGNWMCQVWNRGANSITNYCPPAPGSHLGFSLATGVANLLQNACKHAQ